MQRIIVRVQYLPVFHLVVLLVTSTACGQESDSATEDGPPVRSEFYNRFDAERIGRKYAPRFDRHAEFNAVSDFRITPPGRWFKTFRIKGQISAGNLRHVVESLQEELQQLAKKSSVTIKTADSVDARPISLLKALCPTYNIKVSSIHGFHVSYEEEGVHGEIDLLAFQFIDGEDGKLRWCVLCAVQEPAVGQYQRN